MPTAREIARKNKKILAIKQNRTIQYPATLGDGYGNLFYDKSSNLVYARIADQIIVVINKRVPAEKGAKVWVGFTQDGLYQVIDSRSSNPTGETGTPFGNYPPANRYRYMAENGGQDPLYIELRAILPLRIGISAQGGMYLDLYRGWVWSGSASIQVARQDLDLSAQIPSTTGKAAWVLITIDNTGAPIQTKGSEVDIADLPATAFPSVPSGTVKKCGVVRVYYGQTAIREGRTNTDIVDLRFDGWNSSSGGSVESVTGDGVDNTDPVNPVMTFPTPADIGADTAGAATTAENNAKSYADGLVVGLWDDRGSFDASVNAYPSSGGSGIAGAILKGDIWTVSVAGTLPTSQVVEIGDVVRALVDTPGNTQANWAIQQNNIGYSAENSANKSTDVDTDKASNTKYPSAKAVYDWAVGLFTNAWVIARTLTGFTAGAGTVSSSDTILQAIQKVVGNISLLVPIYDSGFIGADQATFDISSIPQTYTSLRLQCTLRSDKAGVTIDEVLMRFNNDSGANQYDSVKIILYNGGAPGTNYLASSSMNITNCAAATAIASGFSRATIDIVDYTNPNVLKEVQTVGGAYLGTGANDIALYNSQAHWRSTAAINRITLLLGGTGKYKQYSRVVLYGVL